MVIITSIAAIVAAVSPLIVTYGSSIVAQMILAAVLRMTLNFVVGITWMIVESIIKEAETLFLKIMMLMAKRVEHDTMKMITRELIPALKRAIRHALNRRQPAHSMLPTLDLSSNGANPLLSSLDETVKPTLL